MSLDQPGGFLVFADVLSKTTIFGPPYHPHLELDFETFVDILKYAVLCSIKAHLVGIPQAQLHGDALVGHAKTLTTELAGSP